MASRLLLNITSEAIMNNAHCRNLKSRDKLGQKTIHITTLEILSILILTFYLFKLLILAYKLHIKNIHIPFTQIHLLSIFSPFASTFECSLPTEQPSIIYFPSTCLCLYRPSIVSLPTVCLLIYLFIYPWQAYHTTCGILIP